MKAEMDTAYPQLIEQQIAMKPYLLERKGVSVMMIEQREKLHKLLSRKEELIEQRAPLMDACWELDADIIFEAFNSGFTVDKGALIDVLANRTRWQINLISDVFERKYDKALKVQILSQMTTLFGSLVTGSQTNLCKLLIYRILEQPERDGTLMKDYISDQDVICELFATRSNQELKCAMEYFDSQSVKTYKETILSKGYANYKKFMEHVLLLNRDETLDSFPKQEAAALADELYKAGAGRTLSVDPEPFIRVFSVINPYQFESINEQYKGKKLKEDIKKCFGGDFGAALLSRCSTKYAYLASRIEASFRGMNPDKNSISRYFGAIS
jgi:Annexin